MFALLAPQVGLEPTTLRLTAACSTDWAIEEYIKLFLTLSVYSFPLYIQIHGRSLRLVRYLRSGSVLSSRAVARQVLSTLRSLTSVFGMGTGGTSSLWPPDLWRRTLKTKQRLSKTTWSSPRPISISQLHMSPCFHLWPINLVVYKGSYRTTPWEILS